jgi:hypothetical protein
LTGLFTAPSHLEPDSVRPAPADSALPDFFTQFEAEFVVDWQVADSSDTPQSGVGSGD